MMRITHLHLALCLLCSLGASAQFTLQDSLQLYWPFSGNVNDASGNGINGILMNGTTSGSGPVLTADRYGNANSAYDLDGTNDWIHVGNTTAMFDYASRTVSMWVKLDVLPPTSASSDQKIALNMDDPGLTYGALALTVAYPSNLTASAGGSGQTITTAFDNTNWHHVVLQRNASNTYYYWLDGVLKVTNTSSPSVSSTGGYDFRLGRARGTTNPRWWNGKIDEVRVYNRVLSHCEVRQLFCSAAPCIAGVGDTIIYQATTFTFTNEGGQHDSVAWSINGTLLSQTDTLSHTFTTPGLYPVVVYASDSNCSLTDTVWVRFLPPPGCLAVDSVFKISETSGNFTATLDPEDNFGSSITPMGDLNGDGVPDIAVGAYQDDDGNTDNGAVYILMLNADGTVQSHQKISETFGGLGEIGSGVRFGHGIANIGDVNGDGYVDLAVGAAWDSDGGGTNGAVWIVFLDSNQQVLAKQKISDTQGGLSEALSGDNFGTSVSGIGDLNGDGVPDIIVGCYNDDDGGTSAGAAFVLLLNANGTVAGESKISNSTFPYTLITGDYFGAGLAGLGDFDNDGYIEVAIGSLQYDATGANSNEGAVYIVSLNSNGAALDAARITEGQGGFTGDLAGATSFAAAITNTGDMDGDGYIDILVSDHNGNDGGSQKGGFWLLSIDSTGYVFNTQKFSQTQGGLGITLDNGDLLGLGLSFIGDLNGDGVPDIAVSAPRDDDGGSNQGAVYLLTIRDTCCPLIADFTESATNICAGTSISFTNTSSNYGSPTFNWYINDSLVSSATNLSHTFNTAGTYLVKLIVTDSCVRSHQQLITVHPNPTADAGSSVFTCPGDSVQLNASGGVTYQWDNAATLTNANIANPKAFPTTTTIYFVTVTDTNGCSDDDNLAVIVYTKPTVTVSGDVLICPGDSSQLTASGGVSYMWSPNQNISATTGASVYVYPSTTITYTVIGSNAQSCKDTAFITVAVDTSLHAVASVLQMPSCFGGNDGSAFVTAWGGPAPYSYLWSNNGTNDTLTNLVSGTYTVTVTDSSGCTKTTSMFVVQPSAISLTMNSTAVLCNGGNTGTANVNASGGTPGYGYAWSSGSASASATNLSVGTYTVTVTDTNGCSTSDSINVTEPSVLLAATALDSNVSCFGGNDGSATATASGGVSPYDFAWSGGGSNATKSNLTAGTHTVTVTDNNGCTDTAEITITQPTVLTVNAVQDSGAVCFGDSNAIATAIANGGTVTYTYLWSNGETTVTANALYAGTQTVTVTDSKGCTAAATLTITQPSPVSVSFSQNNANCFGESNGSAMANGSGGTGAFTYAWSNAVNNSVISGLSAGVYTVTASDANGCSTTGSVTITQPSQLSASAIVTSNVSCFGESNGSASVSASGGTPGYGYAWSSGSTSTSATNLSAGTYTVTVTDAHGCSATSSTTVTQPTPLAAATALDSNVSCFGGNDGSATATASGGVSPYDFAWSGGGSNATKSNLTAGTHTVTVTDNNGCTDTAEITITQPTVLTVNAVQDSGAVCFGDSNAIATAIANGGTVTYTYLWSNGETAAIATALYAGTQTVTVTDSKGCIQTTSLTITQPTPVIAILDSTKDVLCNGFYDGLAFTSASGGTGGHSFLWNTGDAIDDIDSLTSGTYILSVKDDNNCLDTAAVTIIELSPIVPNVTHTNVTCFGGNNASATSAATGGGSSHVYLWNTGAATIGLTALVADTYVLTITDEYNCFGIDTALVTQPDSIQFNFTVTDVTCDGYSDGSVLASVSGGTGAMTFAWSSGGSDSLETGLDSGLYQVSVTDMSGCTNTDVVTVQDPDQLTVSATLLIAVSCKNQSDGFAVAAGTGGVGTYAFQWSNFDANDTLDSVMAGTYAVTVTDTNGCTATNSVVIPEPDSLLAFTDSIAHALCYRDSNGYLAIATTGGNGGVQYSWTTAETSPAITNLPAGTYTVTVTDSKGCSITHTDSITQPDTLIANITYTQEIVCKYDADGALGSSVSGGTMPYTYAWSTAQSSAGISALDSGHYALSVTDDHGCIDTASIHLLPTSHLAAHIDSVHHPLCYNDSLGYLAVAADSGITPYNYTWSNTATTAIISGLLGGTYAYTVTDSVGCVETGSAFIQEPTPLVLVVDSVIDVLCFSEDDGRIYTSSTGGSGTHSYVWSNTATTAAILNLDSGMYVLTVTDTNGCTAIDSALVNEPADSVHITLTVSDASCLGGANGSIASSSIGGTTPYTYAWSNEQTTANATALLSGVYTLTVTDAHGCTYTAQDSVAQPTTPDTALLTTSHITCFGDSNGTITATFVNGTAPFQYFWDNGQTTQTATQLGSGTYNVTLTDSVGCIQVGSDSVEEPALLVADVALVQFILCAGDSNGSLAVTGTGGRLPYSYVWSNLATDSLNTQLDSGWYVAIVTDASGCTVQDSFYLNQPPALVIDSFQSTRPSCFGLSDGALKVFHSGGTMPFAYTWSNGSSLSEAVNLSADTHNVTITDSNGCVASAFFVLTQPPALAVVANEFEPAFCSNSSNGVAVAFATGGTGQVTFLWSNGDTTAAPQNLLPDTYSVTVTDENLCTATDTAALGFINESPTVDVGPDTAFCNLPSFTLTHNGTEAHLHWSTGSDSTAIVTTKSGTYGLTVTDTTGCASTDEITLVFNVSDAFDLGPDTTICVDTVAQEFTLYASENFAHYAWSNGETTRIITAIENGSYTVTATTAENCASTATIALAFDICLPFLPECDDNLMVAYPSPTFDIMTVELCVWPAMPWLIYLYDMQGRLLEGRVTVDRYNHFDMSVYAEGVYVLKLISVDGRATLRVVKL